MDNGTSPYPPAVNGGSNGHPEPPGNGAYPAASDPATMQYTLMTPIKRIPNPNGGGVLTAPHPIPMQQMQDFTPINQPSQYPYGTTPNAYQSTMPAPGLPPPSLPPPGGYVQPHQQVNQMPPSTQQTISMVKNGRRYNLEVVQQPQRARMCGFGDKDRRPITPPPCIRLIVTDINTNREVDYSDSAIIDPSYFVLCVDLWDDRGGQEVNLVRHSNSSPAVSISAATPCSYPPPPERPYIGLLNPNQMQHYYPQSSMGYAPQQFDPSLGGGYGAAMAPSYIQAAQTPVSIVPNHSQGMYTRNLIGSLAVNAAKLQDDRSQVGLWFVLQDLSVRTEGVFRLHMRFIDVSDGQTEGALNQDHAPVLASCFSDTFQVYSAKKFPGVVESTPLSRAFATQGIKIPIRKDGNKIANQAEYDADDK